MNRTRLALAGIGSVVIISALAGCGGLLYGESLTELTVRQVNAAQVGDDETVLQYQDFSEDQRQLFDYAYQSSNNRSRVQDHVRYDASYVSYDGDIYELELVVS